MAVRRLILLGLVTVAAAWNSTTYDTYDYVIAGAGTAGLLLAVILSENPDITVCVLEAGADGTHETNITNPELRGESILDTPSP